MTSIDSAIRRRLPDASGLCLGLGVALLAALWLSPLPQLSQRIFSVHMVLHLLVICGAAPLIAFWLARRLPPLSGLREALNWGLLAAAADLVIVWGWHAPLLHALAGRSLAALYVQQFSFLGAGIAVWTLAWSARSREAIAIAAAVLFFTFSHMSMFGVVITLAPALLYDPSLCLGGFGLSSLDDQRLGGILMAIGGGMPYLIGTSLLIYRFLEARPDQQSSPPLPHRLPPPRSARR